MLLAFDFLAAVDESADTRHCIISAVSLNDSRAGSALVLEHYDELLHEAFFLFF